MADGGIYSWRPVGGTPKASGEEVLGQAVRRVLDGDYEAHYFSASIDLGGDARPESVVLVAGPMVCGSGGCNLMVFTQGDDGLRLVSSISVVRAPVRAMQQRSHGWRNLVVHVSGGGAVAHDAELRFDGTGYPANPTVPPATKVSDAAQAEVLIPEFGSFREGKPVPAMPADYGNPDDPVAGTVLGSRIRTRDAEELRYVVVQRLTDRYAVANGIEVSAAEQDAYIGHVQEFMKQDRAQRQAAGEEQAANVATPAGEESDEDRAARRQIATAFIKQWKINRALYQQYGGRIIFQQGGAEPLDAYRTFLEEAQARGDFRLLSRDLEAGFWRYYRTDSIHSFYPPGSQEMARAFSTPPWQLKDQAITP
jgi:hypothetical protein